MKIHCDTVFDLILTKMNIQKYKENNVLYLTLLNNLQYEVYNLVTRKTLYKVVLETIHYLLELEDSLPQLKELSKGKISIGFNGKNTYHMVIYPKEHTSFTMVLLKNDPTQCIRIKETSEGVPNRGILKIYPDTDNYIRIRVAIKEFMIEYFHYILKNLETKL